MICVDSKCSMLPDQRVGWCSCTCRESNEPMRATTIFARIFFARCSALQEVFFVTQESSLQDALPCKKSFLLSQAFFSACVVQKVVFHDLHHYMFIDPFVHVHVNAISDPHIMVYVCLSMSVVYACCAIAYIMWICVCSVWCIVCFINVCVSVCVYVDH